MIDLFSSSASDQNLEGTPTSAPHAPLAVRMRPQSIEEFVGQAHLLGEGKILRRVILSDRLSSVILFGPPGSGKTTLAYLISRLTKSVFRSVNAVSATVQDLRKIIEEAKYNSEHTHRRTILFVDEIHRFNKSQQDVLMPDVENGTLILIGATTHNPSFSINGPLLSRSLLCELKPLTETDLIQVMTAAIKDPDRGFGKIQVDMSADALGYLAKYASGDARRALNALEIGVLTTEPSADGLIRFDRVVAQESCQKRIVYYDHDEDHHYDTASAFIKSMRGSDPDSAVYWLAKMLYAGEDPRFIARRIVILASEDIGNADPQALILASAGLQAIEFVGMPEARIILSQLVTYMATAPKSNASYMAIENATSDIQEDAAEEVPNHLRDKSYFGAKRMNRGTGYQYSHNFPGHVVDQEYMKTKKTYYVPTEHGYENEIKKRLKEFDELKSKNKSQK